ncbi:MAG: 30S ribosomal protein S8 [Candidatus Woesearchaeota archaeon]
MTLNDPLANVLSQLNNAIKVGNLTVTTNQGGSLVINTLLIMKEVGYLDDVQVVNDQRGDYCVVKINTSLNKCGVIKPRFAIQIDDFEKFEKRFLPAKGFGFLLVSTNKGLMIHTKAKDLGIGGRLISYCY